MRKTLEVIKGWVLLIALLAMMVTVGYFFAGTMWMLWP